MKIPVCIFTYSGSALLVPWSVRLARLAGLVPVICDDAADPLPPNVRGWLESDGVERIATTFPRRGNLNGTDCAAGICRVLASVARRYRAPGAIKADPDAAVIDPRVFTRHPRARAVGLTWPGGRPGAYGMAYYLRADAADRAAIDLERRRFDPRAPEDITIWQTVKARGPVIERCFRPGRGPFTSFPLGADAADGIRRFDVLNVGTKPPGGWRDGPRQMAGELGRIYSALTSAPLELQSGRGLELPNWAAYGQQARK